MKSIIPKHKDHRILNPIVIVGMFITMLSITSCIKEVAYPDGRPGRAYLSLTFTNEEPDYIDPGTSSIPEVFYWGDYYRAYPGIYTLYYETPVWNGYAWGRHCWEIDYEIWTIPGEPGSYYHYGRDGADTYFTLDLAPFGPSVYEETKGSVNNSSKYDSVIKTADGFVATKKQNGLGFKATYRQVKQRQNKSEFTP